MDRSCLIIQEVTCLVQAGFRTEVPSTPKFDLTGVRTHDLWIMTVHFMSPETPALTTGPSVTSLDKTRCQLNDYQLRKVSKAGERTLKIQEDAMLMTRYNYKTTTIIGRGPRGPPLPPPGDFCRHIFLKTMDLELPKSDCLQEIRWCIWLW